MNYVFLHRVHRMYSSALSGMTRSVFARARGEIGIAMGMGGGHEAYDVHADEVGMEYLTEEVGKQLQTQGLTGEALDAAVQQRVQTLHSKRVELNRQFWSLEQERAAETTTVYELRRDEQGEMKFWQPDAEMFLDDMLHNTKRYAQETNQPHLYNAQEARAIRDIQKRIVTGEVVAGSYPVWHPSERVRYFSTFSFEDGKVQTTYTDVGSSKRDLTHQEAVSVMEQVASKHNAEAMYLKRGDTYPVLLAHQRAIDTTTIARMSLAKTIVTDQFAQTEPIRPREEAFTPDLHESVELAWLETPQSEREDLMHADLMTIAASEPPMPREKTEVPYEGTLRAAEHLHNIRPTHEDTATSLIQQMRQFVFGEPHVEPDITPVVVETVIPIDAPLRQEVPSVSDAAKDAGVSTEKKQAQQTEPDNAREIEVVALIQIVRVIAADYEHEHMVQEDQIDTPESGETGLGEPEEMLTSVAALAIAVINRFAEDTEEEDHHVHSDRETDILEVGSQYEPSEQRKLHKAFAEKIREMFGNNVGVSSEVAESGPETEEPSDDTVLWEAAVLIATVLRMMPVAGTPEMVHTPSDEAAGDDSMKTEEAMIVAEFMVEYRPELMVALGLLLTSLLADTSDSNGLVITKTAEQSGEITDQVSGGHEAEDEDAEQIEWEQETSGAWMMLAIVYYLAMILEQNQPVISAGTASAVQQDDNQAASLTDDFPPHAIIYRYNNIPSGRAVLHA